MSMAILVPSFDKYSFLWPIFFKLFKKNWSDCPYKVYLGSNFLSSDLDWVTDIKIGTDTTWGLKVSKMLQQIPEEYVLIILEDFFIIGPVNNSVIDHALKFMTSKNIDCFGLHACPGPEPFVESEDKPFGELLPGQPYRVNAQVSIWKKGSLLKLLRPQYSPWDFETWGTQAAKRMNLSIWGSYKPIIHYQQAIGGGKWFREAVDICKENGFEFNFSERGFYERKPPRLLNRIKGVIKEYLVLPFYR